MSSADGRLLAIDWGTKRIGVAVSDPTGTVAQPLVTLRRRAGRRFPLQQLRTYLAEYRPVRIVVGLPLEPGGGEGSSARAARETSALIATKTGIPVTLVDERMTTARVRDADAAPGDRVDTDQRAATVLLQAYLDGGRR
jgi:putative Holliday junction resolvase